MTMPREFNLEYLVSNGGDINALGRYCASHSRYDDGYKATACEGCTSSYGERGCRVRDFTVWMMEGEEHEQSNSGTN